MYIGYNSRCVLRCLYGRGSFAFALDGFLVVSADRNAFDFTPFSGLNALLNDKQNSTFLYGACGRGEK